MIGASHRRKSKFREGQPKTIQVRERWYWRILWMFLVPLLLFLALAFVFSLVPQASDWVPFNLHSVLASDYSSDLHVSRQPELNIQVIEEVLVDRGAPTVPGRMATFQVMLLTPVPSVTPTAPLGGARPPGNDSNPTPTLSGPGDKDAPTQTPLATVTELPTPTTTPTNLPSATLSPTPTVAWLPPVLPSPTKSKPTNPPPTKVPPTKIPPTQPPPTQIPPTATQPPPPTQPPPTKPPKPYPGPPPTPKATPYP